MHISPLDSCREQQKLKQENNKLNQIPFYNITLNLIFFFLLILIDVALFISISKQYQFIIPKIGVTVIILILTLIMSKKINHLQLNILLLIVKGLSVLFIYQYKQDYILAIAFILQENDLIIEPWENFCQRVLVKIGCLIVQIFSLNLFNIIIITSTLLMDVFKYIIRNKNKNLEQIDQLTNSLKNKLYQETFTFSLQDNIWKNKLLNLPFCYFLLSLNEMKILFKNRNSHYYFPNIYESEQNLEEYITRRMEFIVFADKNIQKENAPQSKTFANSNISSPILENLKRVLFDEVQEKQTLEQILETYKENGQCIENNLRSNFEIIGFHQQNENNLTTYAGQIIINKDEDEVILVLVDITKQIEFQEEKIKDQFKSSIVQSFSHELRTPLNSSLNFLQYCENDKSINDEIKKNFISPAINALHLQSYLINDIIDFSSLCSDNFKLDVINVTVEQIVNEVNKLFKSVLQMKNLELYVDLTQNQLNNIGTDYTRLIQILANLLQNSIKYTNKGNITLKISSKSQSSLKISIKDQGFGIEECRLKQIRIMLREIEENKNFSQQENWHGFGLLISQMLHQQLQPANYKSLRIKSAGYGYGTKVSFYVKNYRAFNKEISITNQNLSPPQISRLRVNLTSPNHHFSLNGTLIIISDLNVANYLFQPSYQKLAIPAKAGQNSALKSAKSIKSDENISCDESFINQENLSQIDDIHQFQPFIFQEKKSQETNKFIRLTKQQKTIIINYQQIQIQEEQESDKQLKKCLENMKCKCKRILSVDDEIFNQKSIEFLLKQQGFEVCLAFNGEEALKVVLETEKCSTDCSLFLLILMDYQMPIMNGLQTTINLKQMMSKQQIPNINIIGLTAFTSKNDIEQCLNSGMTTVLSKPLKISEFLQIIKQI